jgi:hypothetical protein
MKIYVDSVFYMPYASLIDAAETTVKAATLLTRLANIEKLAQLNYI